MPHLDPSLILERFSRFTREDVRPTIDDEFVRGQVGSMSSTLSFLATEIERRRESVDRQQRAFLEALDELEDDLDPSVLQRLEPEVADARERVTNTPPVSVEEREEAMLASLGDLLAEIDDVVDDEAARTARGPLYDVLELRVRLQLKSMGRDS